MNCVLYARVSTDKQAEKDLSIPAQLQLMRDYARQRGWAVVEEFIEPGVSAKTTERPELQRLLARVSQGDPKVDIVVVHKIDRWARKLMDHVEIQARLSKAGVRLASVSEQLDDSASGKLIEHVFASFAEFYSENLANEVKKGMRQKVLQGGWPHLPPRGYILVRGEATTHARVEKHPKDASLVGIAFERYATGWHSYKTLAASLKHDGLTSKAGHPLSPAQIQRMLTNPFYTGRINWKDLSVQGKHEPLVSQQLFQRVAEVLRKRVRDPGAKGSVRGFPLRGIAICASCRGHMTAGWHKRRFGYYRCSRRSYNRTLCPARGYCPSKTVEAQVEAVCRSLRLDRNTMTALGEAAEDLIRRRAVKSAHALASFRTRRSKLAERELTLTEQYIAGTIASEPYKAAAMKVRDELARVEAEGQRATLDPEALRASIANTLSRITSLWQVHEELDQPRQTQFLRSVFENVVLAEDGMVGFTLRAPLDAVFKGAGIERPHQRTKDQVEQLAQQIIDHVESESAGTPTQFQDHPLRPSPTA